MKMKNISKLVVTLILIIVIIYIIVKLNIYNHTTIENNITSNNNFIDENTINEDIIDENIETNNTKSLGSAGKINDTTIIISIFADDSTTNWDYSNKEDEKIINDTLENIDIATKWLNDQVKRYNQISKFIYDWKVYEDLKYQVSFNETLVRSDKYMYNIQKSYIEKNIDSENIKKKYNANNVIYMFFFNTDYSNTISSWTLSHTNSEDYDIEIINIFNKCTYYTVPPSSYAHEILHCFGAYDYYYASPNINLEYVNYLKSINSDDIMFGVSAGKEITNSFSDLDAYYVGLKESTNEVEKWSLSKSEHDNKE